MTREEAIMILKNEQPHCGKRALFPEEKKYEAYDVAIKALEQQPCEDAISRQTVIDIVDRYSESRSNVEDVTQDIISGILALPPVNPQPKTKTGHWIKDDITERSKSEYKHKCDKCGAYHRAMYDYCPSCGAKMVEPQESEE